MSIIMNREEIGEKYMLAMAALKRLENNLGDNPTSTKLRELSIELVENGIPNLAPLLPLLLNLKGRPYTLKNHFPFEPFFNVNLSRNVVLITGRQVSKSTSLAAQGVILSNCIPYFNTLFVTPLFELIRRFSGNYVRGFIDESPVKRLWTSSETSSNVLQRSFTNNSNMFFSFAFLNADRTRGLNCDKVAYDEVQDLDETFIPVIAETMSGSPYGGLQQFAGTPKILDNTLEKLFQRSSMAEWVIPCRNCRYENIPGLEYDLLEMIGPWHENICEGIPGVICAKCRRPIFPRDGRWVHNHPDRVGDFNGYHVPQLIMPMHYADPDKWQIFVGKSEGLFGTPENVFYNECCGESHDTGSKLVTITDIRSAATLHKNELEIAKTKIYDYTNRVLSVDWGGGGIAGVSFTKYAVLGMASNGEIHTIYGYCSMTPHDFKREAEICLELIGDFKCSHLVHDYSGAGAYREKFVIDAGFPSDRVVPVWYVRTASQSMFRFIPASESHPRNHYKCDKARSLIITCSEIKSGRLKFFEYDHLGDDRPGLLHDFLALVEEKSDSKTGRDIYTIVRQQNQSDDFAQAVNIGCCALWHMTGRWPNLALAEQYRPDADSLEEISPTNPDWQAAIEAGHRRGPGIESMD